MKQLLVLTIFLITNYAFSQIGIKQYRFEDVTRNRLLKTTILYPTKDTADQTFGGNKVFEGFGATLNAEIDTNIRYPLCFLIHGTSGNWKNLSWIGKELATKGYIVVAANHPGSTTGDAQPETVIQMWNQPQDVSFLLDTLLQTAYAPIIDTNSIFVIGSSLGGYSALALTGARLNFEKFPAFCKTHEDISSQYFRPVLPSINQVFIEKANQSLYDNRIDRAVAMVPGFMEVIDLENKKSIRKPSLIIGASLDENVPPRTHYHPFKPNFPSNWSYIEILEATHFSFLQICKANAVNILKEDGEEFVCLEKGSKTRAKIHRETFGEILRFLESN
jgi:predicted dienelactone hydrolase